jgi:anti-sigma B factor antagonist/stage II sporulation protein AA (anti-sigma F factor antagonist)
MKRFPVERKHQPSGTKPNLEKNLGRLMEIASWKVKDALVVSVKGRLDAGTSPDLEKELTEVIAQGETLLVLDFGYLDYISSAGLRTILATTKRLKEKQGRVYPSSLKEMVKEVFEISGFNAIIPIYESLDLTLAEI